MSTRGPCGGRASNPTHIAKLSECIAATLPVGTGAPGISVSTIAGSLKVGRDLKVGQTATDVCRTTVASTNDGSEQVVATKTALGTTRTSASVCLCTPQRGTARLSPAPTTCGVAAATVRSARATHHGVLSVRRLTTTRSILRRRTRVLPLYATGRWTVPSTTGSTRLTIATHACTYLNVAKRNNAAALPAAHQAECRFTCGLRVGAYQDQTFHQRSCTRRTSFVDHKRSTSRRWAVDGGANLCSETTRVQRTKVATIPTVHEDTRWQRRSLHVRAGGHENVRARRRLRQGGLRRFKATRDCAKGSRGRARRRVISVWRNVETLNDNAVSTVTVCIEHITFGLQGSCFILWARPTTLASICDLTIGVDAVVRVESITNVWTVEHTARRKWISATGQVVEPIFATVDTASTAMPRVHEVGASLVHKVFINRSITVIVDFIARVLRRFASTQRSRIARRNTRTA